MHYIVLEPVPELLVRAVVSIDIEFLLLVSQRVFETLHVNICMEDIQGLLKVGVRAGGVEGTVDSKALVEVISLAIADDFVAIFLA